ncbi:hemolysin [Cryptosporidium sp. chipmunk genotype I]|uniref:hemolysin n=1 Tax=Cryptosporidium sp. chipmunk genotype I TaxID=1280935 RepID=UPI003519FF6D|nr:hemolysin [Cryptosporidium sp. chipmunk genotype I]
MNPKIDLDQGERTESKCPEPLNEFSNMYKHKRMPCRSALNFGENNTNIGAPSFIPEYPTAYYSNPEVMNQGTNSLVDTKQLYNYSSPVGDLEKTIEHYRMSHDMGWSASNSFTPTNSGSLELFPYERRDSPITVDPLKNYPSFERMNSGFFGFGKKPSNSIFPIGQKLERLSSNEIISNINGLSEIENGIENGDIPLVDLEQYTQLPYFEKYINFNIDQIK